MHPQPRHEDRQLPSLAHFVVFNPTLATRSPKPNRHDSGVPPQQHPDSEQAREPRSPSVAAASDVSATDSNSNAKQVDRDRDRDLEDDLREAAQIVFYTSREAGGVSRDRMLRQVGLAKGLIGFAE